MSHLPVTGLSGMVSRFQTGWAGRNLTRLPWGAGDWIAAQYEKRFITTQIKLRLDNLSGLFADEMRNGSGIINSRFATARRIGNTWEESVIENGTYGTLNPWWKTTIKSAGVAGLISFGFQMYDDWGNPYLTGGQKIRRSLISTLIGSTATATGGVTAWGLTKLGAALGTTIEPGLGTAVGAVVGFGVGLWGELWLAPQIFEGTGNSPERHLSPLP
jgi:hypothetical protein